MAMSRARSSSGRLGARYLSPGLRDSIDIECMIPTNLIKQGQGGRSASPSRWQPQPIVSGALILRGLRDDLAPGA